MRRRAQFIRLPRHGIIRLRPEPRWRTTGLPAQVVTVRSRPISSISLRNCPTRRPGDSAVGAPIVPTFASTARRIGSLEIGQLPVCGGRDASLKKAPRNLRTIDCYGNYSRAVALMMCDASVKRFGKFSVSARLPGGLRRRHSGKAPRRRRRPWPIFLHAARRPPFHGGALQPQ